ncbi:unnamed protein product [Malus baccata var. baccata]
MTRVETVESNVDPNEQVMDILNNVYPYASTNTNEEGGDDSRPTMDSEAFKNYEKLLKNAKQELYPGCENFSVFTAIVELMHGKIKFHLSNKCFDYFLGVIKRMLPKDNCLPKDHKSAQKVLKGLGLGYQKIHACVNNCILFYKENRQLDKCPVCNESRFKMTSQNRKTKIPQKVMRYLPLKPRLQRLYMSMHTATDMRWHKERRENDDVMRHPADGEAWKEFDRMYPDFATDPRNIRLGLATDGFNPFGVLNQTHSIWPIVVFPYNLPPWKCMKKEYMMLTVLITEDPRKSIDVYLRPLVDELKDLWENGVRTYDKSTGHMFTMRAAVMWTVNNFPAYAMVSGWMTKGYLACPICKENVTSSWHARKVCYLGHRRWLPWDNEWRHNDKAFHAKETQPRPREWSGDEILDQLNRLEFGHFGKGVSEPRPTTHLNWTHKSILFELPYWSKLKLRHNLDVMHIEKNVFDTLVRTILDIEGKTKDTIEARLDLERMGIRSSLWMKKVGDTLKKCHPFFTVKPNGKKEFFNFISSVKFPDGYLGELKKSVRNKAKPEGSLVEAWVAYESLTFCGMYLQDVETAFNRPQRNNDGGVRKEKLCQVILFKCLWFDTNPHSRTSVKQDHGLLSVNTTKCWYNEDPYILATMAKQIFYLDDPKAGSGWKVVQKIDRRGLYDIPELDHDDNDDNVADQQFSSLIEIGEETLRGTNVVQEPFEVAGVPEFEISIDLGDLPQYNAPKEANEDEDEWKSENDSSEDSESYYCYDYIRCEALMHDGSICGHAAHIDCALRCYMAGTWSMRLEGEEVKVVALGTAWVAAITSLNFLRIFTDSGLQKHVLSLDGPVVTASGFKDELAIVTHASDCLPSNEQMLEFRVLNITKGSEPLRGRLPLTPGSHLTWFGFSEEGQLSSYDSKGAMRVFTSQYGGSWLPLFRFKILLLKNIYGMLL